MNKEKTSSDFKISESLENFSFVLGCGSGCALTYNVSEIEQNEKFVTIEFKVEMYINEKVTDEYFDAYRFKTNPNQVVLDESGAELSHDTHPMLLDKLTRVFDYLE